MERFSNILLEWYDQNARELPWRKTKNPYFIWLSEIILQQTRVDQGLSYYLNFIETFPDVYSLANATQEEVLKCWQGLGYYSRARNLHFTAQHIAEKLNGKFPDSYEKLIQLKGIGPYTAAAISSISFNENVAVIDGNVFRFLSRYFDLSTPIDSSKGRKEFQALANRLISSERSGDFNQGMMEIGAKICKPKKWECDLCPFKDSCLAFKNHTIDQRPVKSKKIKIKERRIHYLVCEFDSKLLFRKRMGKDIWQGLYDFPEQSDQLEMLLGENNYQILDDNTEMKHILSHQILFISFKRVRIFDVNKVRIKGKWALKSSDSGLPHPRIIEKYLDEKPA